MPSTTFIYALNCPITGRTRYVGKANNPEKRLILHISQARKHSYRRACWIRSLLSNGQKPSLEILDEVPETEWQFWECEWIRLYRALGFDLTNGTEGGEGMHNPSSETRERMSRAQKGNPSARRGHKPSEETRLKLSLSHMGNKNALGHVVSDEARKKMSANHVKRVPYNLGKKTPQAVCEKLKAAWVRRKEKLCQPTL